MSLRRHLLNSYLRRIARPRLARLADPLALRRSFERQARWFFRAPRGTAFAWRRLGPGGAGPEALEITPPVLRGPGLILYLHGGAFLFGSPRTHAAMVARLAAELGVRALLPRYRLAPEHPFPAAPEDALTAWQALLAEGQDPAQVVLGGDSAGGALTLGLLAELCRGASPRPCAAFCLSPLTDMTFSGESFRSNRHRELLLAPERAEEIRRLYLAGHPATDPRASPLRADFPGAPPIWLTAASGEILFDDARRMAERLRHFEVPVTLRPRQDLPHVWPILQHVLPEGRETLEELARWIRQQPGWPGES